MLSRQTISFFNVADQMFICLQFLSCCSYITSSNILGDVHVLFHVYTSSVSFKCGPCHYSSVVIIVQNVSLCTWWDQRVEGSDCMHVNAALRNSLAAAAAYSPECTTITGCTCISCIWIAVHYMSKNVAVVLHAVVWTDEVAPDVMRGVNAVSILYVSIT